MSRLGRRSSRPSASGMPALFVAGELLRTQLTFYGHLAQ